MCGIAGYVAPPGQRADRSILERMVGALRHRGPDGCGYLVEGRAALGVARLRVIDLDTGDQPLHGEDGRLSAVVNGEIYNFADLRAQLHHRGHRFATRSDSEVVVHAWEEWGEKALEHLNGMFAMALWDRGHEQLILARDRMGEKPLYYAVAGGALVFGSELRALLAHPGVARGLDLRGVARYLAFDYVPDPRSILEGVSKVPPGHVLTAGRDVSLAAYWDLTFQPDPTLDEAAWGDEIRRRFDRAVERRLASDVPLGCFLSGGVDSSAVAATAARFRPGIRTFSVGYARSPHDERRWARLVAERCGTTHEELEVGAADARHVMERLGDLLDEPLADMSFVPLYLLAGAARRRVTVALTGDGGDELFAGYPTMAAAWWHRRAATLPAPVVATLERAGRVRWLPDDLRRFLGALGERPEARNQVLLGGLRPSRYAPLLSAAARAALDGFDPYQDIEWTLERCPTEEPTARLIYQYCKLYLAGQNLVNADRASMAVGLELRAPFLDHTFVDLLGRVPSALKLTGLGGLKRLVKRALADRLPPEIRRRGKQGFGVPFAAWFRGPLASTVRAMLAPSRVAAGGLLDPGAVQRLVDEHLEGRADHHRVLWALVTLEAWRVAYLGDGPAL